MPAPQLGDLTITEDGEVIEPDETPTEEEEPEAPAAEEEEAEEEPEAEGEPDDDAEWLRQTGDELGLDLSKYKTRKDALAGLGNAAKKLGERDDYAKFGRELLAHYAGREDELQAILEGRAQRQQPAPATTDDLPKTPEEAELLRSQIRVNDDGEVVPVKGAPPDAVARYQRYSQELQRRLHAALFQPKEFFRQQAGIDPEAQAQQLQQQIQLSALQREQQDWVDRHAKDLWVDGDQSKGLTPLGQLAQEDWVEHGSFNSVKAWEASLKTARKLMPKPAPRKISQAARHRPTATPTGTTKVSLGKKVLEAASDKEAEDLVVQQLMRDSGYEE